MLSRSPSAPCFHRCHPRRHLAAPGYQDAGLLLQGLPSCPSAPARQGPRCNSSQLRSTGWTGWLLCGVTNLCMPVCQVLGAQSTPAFSLLLLLHSILLRPGASCTLACAAGGCGLIMLSSTSMSVRTASQV